MSSVERDGGSTISSHDFLWRKYSADFQQNAPSFVQQQVSKLDDPFVCPLCLYAFSRVPNIAEIATKEHILPSSLGGRLISLTCRDCNNQSGSQLESHLVQRVRVSAREKPVLVTVDFGSARFRAEMQVPKSDGNKITIVGIGKQSDPRQVKRAIQILDEEEWHGREVKLDLDLGYIPLNSDVALVRIAYLYMFWRFGYRYVFNESAIVIREQLNDVKRETSVLKGVKWHEGIKLPNNPCFAVAIEPAEFHTSIGVFLELDQESGIVATVTLPPVNSDGAAFYEKLDQIDYSGKITYKYP